VVVPSRFTAARVLAVTGGAGAAITVVPNGVELPPPAAPPAIDGDPGYLLHVGHLEARKNLAVVLHALAQLPAAQRPRLRLVGADAGAGSGLRREVHRFGLAAWVEFLGCLDDAAVARLLAAARAVVVPSVHEGFGLPALEALAHGRPVLVAEAGALPEVVGTEGVVLPPHDARAWALAIAASAPDPADAPDRRRTAAAAHGWQQAAAGLLAVWRAAQAPLRRG
jgi:glycosyltransferase involved in cell wall biosynthesis